MAQPFPYTYYSCPCVDTSAPSSTLPSSRKSSAQQGAVDAESSDEDEPSFDPRSPRANFSLYPLEHLLYCTECHQIRCARCTAEEVVCWYCPTCLFEVPSSTVRSEGVRCNRNCYNCPICTSPLTVNPLELPQEGSKSDAPSGPFIFVCSYCNWTSLDIGIKFDKHNNITGQLRRIKNGGRIVPTPKERESQAERLLRAESRDAVRVESSTEDGPSKHEGCSPDQEEIFSNLQSFYRTQLLEQSETAAYASSTELAYSSPSSITRLLNLYSGKKTRRPKPKPMREADSVIEGLQLLDLESEAEALKRIHTEGFQVTTSTEQRGFQEKHAAQFVNGLRPVASLLRTKRSKRCKICRTLLSRPEPKISSTRYKIRLLALNNIPKVTLRSLSDPATNLPNLGAPLASNAFQYSNLSPLRTYQFLLTVANPLFDTIKVTLATPATTPGRVSTRVTMLCPQFDVGANTDVWDEALNSSISNRRKSQLPNLSSGNSAVGDEDGQKQAEAGKTWGKGRNWTSVIVEVVPGLLPQADEDDLEEDEDVLEIPVFVRIEYEVEIGGEERVATTTGGGPKEKREVAFWSILGVGRIKS